MARKAGLPKKRNGIYYANETHRGVRLRDCLHTDNFDQAKLELDTIRKQVDEGQRGALSSVNREWLKYTVSEALDALIEERKKEWKADRTLETDRQRSRPLKRLIGKVLVRKITADTISSYQSDRLREKVNGRTNVGGRTINMETTLLRLVLKRAKRWGQISEAVKNLPESRDVVARVLTEEEKLHLFETASARPEWYRAYYCAVIAVNTTGRKIEILRARLRDVNFFEKVWTIPRSKTRAGVRRIPLNDEALDAFAELKRKLEELRGGEPDDYFFPACQNNDFDFTRHQKTVRTAWRALTRKAGLRGFRLHDLRHQCLTEMAEAGESPDVMMEIAGHVSDKMRRYYVHVRDQAMEKAVAALPGTGLARARSAEISPAHVN